MASRKPDLTFDAGELLWRRIERGDLSSDGALKPARLRLQISVVRQRYGERATAVHEKWNGIAETTAAAVAGLKNETIKAECIDEPTDAQPGHALIAMVVQPGDAASQELIDATRVMLAMRFSIAVHPTKV